MKRGSMFLTTGVLAVLSGLGGCGDDDSGAAFVQIKNDFNNPEMAYQPPWTICESSYLDVEFGKIEQGDTSEKKEVVPGLDHVLMVAAWDDPTCAPEHCLPIATANEEEIVDGQTRVIAVNMPNHKGPCPPEGTEPISEDLYSRIRALWPDYGFKPYAERTENTQCADDEEEDETDTETDVEDETDTE